MKQAVLLIDCYLYGTIAILAVVLLVLVYLHGQANHLPNPFVRKNIIYRPAPKARGVLLGQKYGLLAYSPERDEGHIIVMGPSGTGKTSALLIPTLRSWQGTALVVDISGDISANVDTPNKIIFDPMTKDCTPYDVDSPKGTHKFHSIILQFKVVSPNQEIPCGIFPDPV